MNRCRSTFPGWTSLPRSVVTTVRSFAARREGSVAVLFALAAIPLFGVIGAAMDYSRTSQIKSALDAGLDEGLLTASRAVQDTSGVPVSRDIVEQAVRRRAASFPDLIQLQVDVQTTMLPGQSRKAVATYTVKAPTALVKVIGIDSLDLAGRAEVQLDRPTYVDIYLVMDVSASMGLAADDAGRRLLAQKTLEVNGKECTFACHIKDDPNAPKTTLEIAQDNNIQTRVDITRSVTATLLDDVRTAQGRNVFGADVYRVGLYSFSGYGVDAGGATTLMSPTSSTETVRPAISSLQLDNATAYKPMLADMTRIVGQSYDGTRTDQRRKYVIILTDGADYGHDWGWSKTIDPNDCSAMKANNVQLYVFNTKWVADWGNWAFDPILGYHQNPYGGGTVFEAMGPKLQECSSGPGFYFEGTDAAEISVNFRKIFQSIQNAIRITK